MKLPKLIRRYCPYCRKHQEHTLERVGRGNPSSLSWISRQKYRKTSRIGNAGKFSKLPGSEKPSKRLPIRFRCKVCRKAHVSSKHLPRSSKFEFKEA